MTTRNTHGIILRTSSALSCRYVYFPIPRAFPDNNASNLDNIFADSLANAPYFPDITILDSFSSNILYKTYSSFPNLFHVYNLINRSHFAFSFPYLITFVNATILISDNSHFKVLVVCINQHPNPSFVEGNNSAMPLIFYLYSSESQNWSIVPLQYALTSDHLLPNRRNPAHVSGDIVYFDLTNRFLVTYWEERIEPIPKLVSIWEKESMKLDEATRYCQSRGKLHCVKYNPIKVRIEVYIWLGPPKATWKLAAKGKKGSVWGRVLGIHPDDPNYVLLRSTETDEVRMVDIQRDFLCVVIEGKGLNCGSDCFFYGMNDVLEAAMSEGVQRSTCGILHPHENIEGPEGDIFITSHRGPHLELAPEDENEEA